jgi:hypothetical protein
MATAFNRKAEWDTRQSTALNQALEDRTRLTVALYNLVSAVQVCYPANQPSMVRNTVDEAIEELARMRGTA